MPEIPKKDMNKHSHILSSIEESKYQEKCSVAGDICSKTALAMKEILHFSHLTAMHV